MALDEKQQGLLKRIPGVDSILLLAEKESEGSDAPRSVVTAAVRKVIDELRQLILEKPDRIDAEDLETPSVLGRVRTEIERKMAMNLRGTINGTGVVVHTNLGRSLLAEEVMNHVAEIAGGYSNLEFNIASGKRGLRYTAVEEIICEISGAEAAMVVNNNAGAVLLCLDTIARGKEVIVSRGELVEIGGSFRIPDVMAKSGGILKEVGTTNRTHLKDYEGAITEETGLFLKVHTSNYSVVGFTASVSLQDMVALGRKKKIPVMDDLGSGTFIDFSKYGLQKEPTVQESVMAGADIVTFSGDKLLGGPQAGIITGKKDYIEAIRKNPLTRALRVDKMTLAGLESTLRIYRDEARAVETIPTLRMLTMSKAVTEAKANRIVSEIESACTAGAPELLLVDIESKAGGGSLPLMTLPAKGVGIRVAGLSANRLERKMRLGTPAVIGRIEDDIFILDPRTIQDDEPPVIAAAVARIISEG